jgi:hypothetical protein
MLTGRSVTGVLHLVNKTPANWFAQKQATVEQIIDLLTALRHLGVLVREKSCMFGDNKSTIGSAAAPHAKLRKCHNALPFHRVQEAIAGKLIACLPLDWWFFEPG